MAQFGGLQHKRSYHRKVHIIENNIIKLNNKGFYTNNVKVEKGVPQGGSGR